MIYFSFPTTHNLCYLVTGHILKRPTVHPVAPQSLLRKSWGEIAPYHTLCYFCLCLDSLWSCLGKYTVLSLCSVNPEPLILSRFPHVWFPVSVNCRCSTGYGPWALLVKPLAFPCCYLTRALTAMPSSSKTHASSSLSSTPAPPPLPSPPAAIKQLPQNIPHLEPDGSNWAIFAIWFREAMQANLLRTRQWCSVAWLECLPQHWIESELRPVWYRRRRQPLDKALVQELGNTQQWTANS